MNVECLRGIDHIIGSVRRAFLRHHSPDDVREEFWRIANDYSSRYADSDGNWCVDNGSTNPMRFGSQFDAQTYAALCNAAVSAYNGVFNAAYVEQ